MPTYITYRFKGNRSDIDAEKVNHRGFWYNFMRCDCDRNAPGFTPDISCRNRQEGYLKDG